MIKAAVENGSSHLDISGEPAVWKSARDNNKIFSSWKKWSRSTENRLGTITFMSLEPVGGTLFPAILEFTFSRRILEGI